VPNTPDCATTPSPAEDGTAVTMTCSGVETGHTLTTPGMTCGSASGGVVTCTGTVGSGGLTDSNEPVTVTDPTGLMNSSATTGLIIDNTPPAGPGTLTGPGNTNNPDEDIVGSCGADAANGTVNVTTTPANGFSVLYDTPVTLDSNGDFVITDPNWSFGSYQVNFDCTDSSGNGPTTLGPFGPVTVDPNVPNTPICSTTPSPAANGESVTMTCMQVDQLTSLTTPGMLCTPDPTTVTGMVTCTGTVGTGGLVKRPSQPMALWSTTTPPLP